MIKKEMNIHLFFSLSDSTKFIHNIVFLKKCFSFSFSDPPKFGKDIKDQNVELGEQLKIKIPYTGTGPFDVKLKKDNQDVPESDKVKITPFDDYIILMIKGNLSIAC